MRWLREGSSVEDEEGDEGLGSQSSRLRLIGLREVGLRTPNPSGKQGKHETWKSRSGVRFPCCVASASCFTSLNLSSLTCKLISLQVVGSIALSLALRCLAYSEYSNTCYLCVYVCHVYIIIDTFFMSFLVVRV